MDSLTQAVLGAAIGDTMLSRKIGNKGAILGACVATLPDLDVAFHLFYDKLDMLIIHRGISHSIAFSIMGAFLIAYMIHRYWLSHLHFKKLLLFTWLTLFTHILLDTFTAYGTQLFAPFSNKRLGFDSINVVDPLYTLPLIVGLLLSISIYRKSVNRYKYSFYGLVISSMYLVFTLINKEVVQQYISEELVSHNIAFDSILTMPVGIANINWYGVAKGEDSVYMLKHSIIGSKDSEIVSFPINEHYFQHINNDIANTMRWFAKGFYTLEKYGDTVRVYNLQVDMRGIVLRDGQKSPTVGYFEVSRLDDKWNLSSGVVK